jgi:hypothetical protein
MSHCMVNVSEQHTQINWEQVASKVTAVYIRALYGSSHVDELLHTHFAGADEADLLVGYYHYVVPGISGRDDDARYQGEQFARLVSGLPRDLPCAVHLATTGSVGVYRIGAWYHDYIGALLDGGMAHWPVVCATDGMLKMLTNRGERDVWLSWCPPQPPLPGARPPLPFGEKELFGWKWTSQGRVPGIEGPVELSWLYHLPQNAKSFRAQERNSQPTDRTLPAWWVGDRLLVEVQSLCEALDLEYSVVPSPEPEREHAVGVMVRPKDHK